MLTSRPNGEVIPISAPTQTPEEAEEIQAVLSSEAFSASPLLTRLFKYLCANHFSEKRCTLNEYRVGVEALGRPADFDPAVNSSVRVEMHRLRGKLRNYYETEGAGRSLKIVLENGRFALQFVRRDDGAIAASREPQGSVGAAEAQGNRASQPDVQPGNPILAGMDPARTTSNTRAGKASTKRMAIAAAIVLVALAFVWIPVGGRLRASFMHAPMGGSKSVVGAPVPSSAESGSVLILAGYSKQKYVDRDGKVWGADRYFSGGEAIELSVPYIQGTEDKIMYSTARSGEFSYDIPLQPGTYELRLHFVETHFGPGTYVGRGESSRVFSVFLGDRPLLSHFDVLSDAGGNFRVLTRVFKGMSAGSDGRIHLKFTRDLDQPFVNAIELVPEVEGRMNTVRIVMQENSYVDHAGHLWSSDQYAIGGVLVAHQNEPVDAAVTDPHLYDGERFGHFTYQIPAAPGHYTVTLHFIEAYFGTEAARDDHGTRVFDVYANGQALLRNLDILERAGGTNKPITETFHGIEPNAAGLIVLDFIPVKNYACLDAIEVTDEAAPSKR